MKYSVWGTAISMVLLLAACDKEKVNDGDLDETPNIVLTVNAYHTFSDRDLDTALAGASIHLYSSDEDRDAGADTIITQVTGQSGRVLFQHLEAQEYYLRATYDTFEPYELTIVVLPEAADYQADVFFGAY